MCLVVCRGASFSFDIVGWADWDLPSKSGFTESDQLRMGFNLAVLLFFICLGPWGLRFGRGKMFCCAIVRGGDMVARALDFDRC